MTTSTEDSSTTPQSLSQVLLTGVLAIALVFAIAALCIAPFEHHFFTDWVGVAFMAATPVQIIIGLLWHNQQPTFVNSFPQPFKGLALLAITVVVGAVVMFSILTFVGGSTGMTPMLVQYTIMTVVITLWVVPILHCWPFSLMSKNPLIIGSLALIASYFIAYALWTVFFSYEVLGAMGHPHYIESLDPKGMFDAWVALTFFVTAVGLIVVHTLFDFWPIDKLSMGMSQPARGIIGTLYILALAWLVRTGFVSGLEMPQVEYMIRVPVCMIFGAFMVNNMMQFSLFPTFAQPVRGVILTICAAVVAVIMYEVYGAASTLHVGHELGLGPANGFAKEIWIASAMLGVTFPIVFLVSGYFGFWPFIRQPKSDAAPH